LSDVGTGDGRRCGNRKLVQPHGVQRNKQPFRVPGAADVVGSLPNYGRLNGSPGSDVDFLAVAEDGSLFACPYRKSNPLAVD
jgi:hypothetical protein